MKILCLIVLILACSACEDHTPANFTLLKGAVVVAIQHNNNSRHNLLQYRLCLRERNGKLTSFDITKYERDLYQLGDTIK